MTARTATRLAWTLMLSVIALALLSIPARHVNAHGGLVIRGDDVVSLLMAALLLGLILLGALIVSRQPGHPIGWLFVGYGFAAGLAFFVGDTYAYLAISDHLPLPGPAYALWFEAVISGPVIFGLFAILFLIFPNGRPLSPLWGIVVRVAVIATVGAAVAVTFQPGPLNNVSYSLPNPFGIPALKGLMGAIDGLSFILILASMAAGAVSLVLRFRRSHGDERQQLKWVAAATALAAVLLLSGPLFWFDVIPGPAVNLWGAVFFIAALIIPLSIGIAMLKYRLYEIDVIINRALVYGSVTVTLGALYVGGVIGLQALFRFVMGQSSDLAVAVATLAVAALFNPWRQRLQTFIDRRFYRHKYDATRTLTILSSQLRDEVDLDQLSADIVALIHETMRPAGLGLWLPHQVPEPPGGPAE